MRTQGSPIQTVQARVSGPKFPMTISMEEESRKVKNGRKMWGSMREFIDELEAQGKLHRVSKEVDPSGEVSCIAY